MNLGRPNANEALQTHNRSRNVAPQSGICSRCVDGCKGGCDLFTSTFRGRELLYPGPFGEVTSGAYKDYRGNRHQRTVEWNEDIWLITDQLSGPFKSAQIRYHLIPSTYRIEGNRVIAPWGTIEVETSACIIRLDQEYESLYYWEKRPLETLVVRVGSNCGTVKTKFSLSC